MAKYSLDLSKLVFAGIIITEIIDFNINKLLLFSVGLIFISLLTFWHISYSNTVTVKGNNMELIFLYAILSVFCLIGIIYVDNLIKKDNNSQLDD